MNPKPETLNSKLKILLIEDNPGDARLIHEMLKETACNCTLDVAERLGAGLQFLASHEIDVVLLDLSLPDSAGLETLTRLQAQFSHLPVVIMTSIDDETLSIQAVHIGAQDYLPKGNVNSELLRRTLKYAIERKQRIIELEYANALLRDSRRAALNMMEDAIAAGRRSEETSVKLQREVIERKRAEADVLKLSEDMAARNVELETVNSELEAFIYSISHDLRAPIRSMAGFARILVEDYAGKLDKQGMDYLGRIYRGSEKMTQLIDDLLRLSRISRQEINCTEVDLSKMAASIISEMREIHPERSVEVIIAAGLSAFADPGLIKIVLSNILENAWKFTSNKENARIEFGVTKGGIRSETSDTPDISDRSKTIFFVKDNGAGFDPLYMEKMFWPFQRLHSEGEFVGTGIGLTIVERIIRRHGGEIWAEGDVGKGATFYFRLGEKT